MQKDGEKGRPAPPLTDFAPEALELEGLVRVLLGFVQSSLGRRALRELVPLEEAEVRSALARVREMQLLVKVGDEPSLGGLCDPQPILESAGEGQLEEQELARALGFLAAAERLVDWLGRRKNDIPALAELAQAVPDLSDLRERLAQVVDERGRIKPDASPLLYKLRREELELSQQIDGLLRQLAGRSDLRNILSDGRVHLRGQRLCLAVKTKSSGRVPGILHDHSQSEQSVFIEPREAIPLGNRLAECRVEAGRELARILVELARTLVEERGRVLEAADALALLELATIATGFAAAYGARCPTLAGDPGAEAGLLLRSACHPLLLEQQREGRLDEVVPVDLRLGDTFDMLIITGPNTGGKTLALKTAGLLCLMVRLGLPIPASEGSSVPLYAGIAADIGDEQEISQSLSTFSSHLLRIQAGLSRARPDTLVLLDELGGGTDPEEGAALGEALLEHLLERGVPTLASTHLGRLKEFAFRHKRAENACAEFDLATLAPRYRLIIGVPGESAALVIARRLGLDPGLVERAEGRLVRRDSEVRELMDDVRDARSEAERARSAAEQRLEDAARTGRELDTKRQEMDRRSDLLEAEAQRGLEERLRGARGALERARALLPQIPARQRADFEPVLAELSDAILGASLTERRKAFLAGLKKGDLVHLPRYRQRCAVKKVDHERREVTVKLGSMKLLVPFDEVTWYESL